MCDAFVKQWERQAGFDAGGVDHWNSLSVEKTEIKDGDYMGAQNIEELLLLYSTVGLEN